MRSCVIRRVLQISGTSVLIVSVILPLSTHFPSELDVLVNNAGLFSPQYRLSADGFELTFFAALLFYRVQKFA
jgi:NAD(P)-dependent dehydrogenase (short-subunit alcohol dehydrogenase family)